MIGEISPATTELAPPAVAPRHRLGDIPVWKRATTAVGAACTLMAGCSPASSESEPVPIRDGVAELRGAFEGIPIPDCPGASRELQPDGSLVLTPDLRNADEFHVDGVNLYAGSSWSNDGGYNHVTRFSDTDSVRIPPEEVSVMNGNTVLDIRIIALPNDESFDLQANNEPIQANPLYGTADGVVYEVLKARAGIEQAANIEEAGVFNGILQNAVVTCKVFGDQSGEGGGSYITPQTPTPTEASPGSTMDPEYVQSIYDIVEELNSQVIETHNLYGFAVAFQTDDEGEETLLLSISVFPEIAGIDPSDENYDDEIDRLCGQATEDAIAAGIDPGRIAVRCMG